MKKHLQQEQYDWTVVTLGGEAADYYYGYNTKTGEKLPTRMTYGDALRDIERREPGKRS